MRPTRRSSHEQETRASSRRIHLESGETVAVVGGGPAGAFFALHLLRGAARLGLEIRVVIFERRHQPAEGLALPECWQGCNHCAGGISPRLADALREMDLILPEALIQCRIRNVTIQGYWKNITLEVPAGREMFTVYRGSRPSRRPDPQHNVDGFLLRAAQREGAEVIGAVVTRLARREDGRWVISYRQDQGESQLQADLLVCAAGVNGKPGQRADENPLFRSLQEILPGYEPPRLRRALIFELELDPTQPAWLEQELHFVEYGSKALPLEMCSLVPKRGFLTVVLVGRCVDTATGPAAASS